MKIESKKPATSEAHRLDHEKLIARFEAERIGAGTEFENLYSDYAHDMERTNNLVGVNNANANEILLGKVSEALVFTAFSEGRASEHLHFRSSHLYDDLFHGVDLIVEPKHEAIPALATLDITINQEDIKGNMRRGNEHGEARPVGIEKKLLRVKGYVDRLARLDPEDARNLLGWIQSGGLHSPHTTQNDSLFKQAEGVFLLKYYKTPEDSREPAKPGYVIGGPQTIISIDTMFVNKALQNAHGARETLHALSFLEFAYGIHATQEYLNGLVKKKPEMNVLFDTHYAKVKAWSHILNTPAITKLINDLTKEHRQDSDFRAQLVYYSNAFAKVFGV